MIEDSYVTVEGTGHTVIVNYYDGDQQLIEGPATFPAREASFAAIITYIETQFNWHRLNIQDREMIESFLGARPQSGKKIFCWKDALPPVGPGL